MSAHWKPLNFIPYLALMGMAIGDLISWWVALAIFIGNITLQE